jgi:ribonuclease HI
MVDGRGRVVAAATDGACSGNPGPGGWGAMLRFEDGSVEEFGGHEPDTTNNRMELQAALAVLQRLKELPRHPDLTLRTDSKYLIDGLGTWIKGWKRKGWKTAAGKPVLNQDLWKDLDQAQLADVPLSYVKGHSGDPDNERVDRIAVAFSHRRDPVLQSAASTSPPEPLQQPVDSAVEPQIDAAPEQLQGLLSRLELADRLAQGGFRLTTVELAQLVEQPMRELVLRDQSWMWRDWWVDPIEEGCWRLRRREGGSEQSEDPHGSV